MPNNIIITPGSASIQFSGSVGNTIRMQVEQSGSVAFYGNSGSLFSIVDQMSGSLMSVNDVSGLPILEVFSDQRVVMGAFNQNTLVVTGSRVGIDKANPQADLDISGSVFITGSLRVSGGVTGSILSSSFASTASFALNAGAGSGFPFSGSAGITGSLFITGSGSTVGIFEVAGTAGTLFNITDGLSGSLMNVNDISGLPILEVFSDDRVVMGTFGRNTLVVTGSNVGIGSNTPTSRLFVSSSGSSQVADFRYWTNPYISVGDGTVQTIVGTADAGGGAPAHGLGGTGTNHSYFIRTNNVNRLFVSSSGLISASGTASFGNAPLTLAQFNIRGPQYTGDPNLPVQLIIQSTEAFSTAPVAGISFVNDFQAGGSAGMGGIKVGKENTTTGDFGSYIALLNRRNGFAVSESLRISSLGNVGIGTTNPQARLEVSGSMIISTGSLTLATGSVITPNRPAFRITGSSNPITAPVTLSGSLIGVDYNQGSHFNTTNGVFTAPLAGLYQINLTMRTFNNSNTTINQAIVYRSGSTGDIPQIMVEFGTNTSMNHVGGSTISRLTVGETLRTVITVGTCSFDQNNNFSVAYIG